MRIDSVMRFSSRWAVIGKVKVMVLATMVTLLMLSVYYSARQDYLHEPTNIRSFKRMLRYLEPAPATSHSLDDFYDQLEENSEYVLDTEGCKIPNMRPAMAGVFSFNTTTKKVTCGTRKIHLVKINATYAKLYTVGKMKYIKNCNYQFVHRSKAANKEDTNVELSPEKHFKGNITFRLESDFIKVTCHRLKNDIKVEDYKDAYAAVKRVGTAKRVGERSKSWNVLVIGLDTMSRIRTAETLKRTFAYFHHNQWIDFRGYQKVGDNTRPNLIALLTGMKISTLEKKCSSSMNLCNDVFLWSKYRNMGYTTAYGEDTSVQDTFSTPGYKAPPTDHYMRPFFLSSINAFGKENEIFCTGKKSIGHHLLDYAKDFALTYKSESFFGFFWLNAFHGPATSHPELIDEELMNFFVYLQNNEVLKNTFVIFVSDHGVRFGEVRKSMASYYEERLPALFMRVPDTFRDAFTDEYNNLVLNRLRLVTPYNLYLTFEDILQKSSGRAVVNSSEGCPTCRSILKPIPSKRTCLEAGVDWKWCSCHKLVEVSKKDNESSAAVDFALRDLQFISENIATEPCTRCARFRLNSILRVHTYTNVKKFFVVAFTVAPGNVGFEATLSYDGHTFERKGIFSRISPYHGNDYCVIKSSVYLCYCEKLNNCR